MVKEQVKYRFGDKLREVRERKGITFLEVSCGGEREPSQVVQGSNIIRSNTRRIHHFPVSGRTVVGVGHGPLKPL